jgi:hypothetical protein
MAAAIQREAEYYKHSMSKAFASAYVDLAECMP